MDSGFQPFITTVEWQPKNEEVIEILIDIPVADFLPHAFLLGSRETMDRTLKVIRTYFERRTEILKEWESFDSLMPRSDFVQDYVDEWSLHIPLKEILFGVSIGINSIRVVKPVFSKKRKFNELELPKQSSSASVKHSGNLLKKVPPPRINLESANIILTDGEKFDIMSKRVKELVVKDFTTEQFKTMCTEAGVSLRGLSNKQKLLER